MNMPSLKTVRQWLPFAGGAAFGLWVTLLVVLSLFSSEQPINSESSAAPVRGEGDCVRMPDGFLICDKLPKQTSAHP